MSKLGISKTQLLSDPKIKLLYEQYMKQKGKGKMRGMGLFDGFVQFLKDSKILSTVGNVVLPVAGAALGGLVSANPLVATAAGAAGLSANQWLKSQGFGARKRMLMGGDSRLTISPMGTRLGQRGTKKKIKGGAMTYSINGTYSQVPATLPGTAIGKQKGGQTTAFNTVSSQFGNIKT
jgi:hypothetical protein